MSLSFSQSEYTVSESNSTFLVQLNKNKPLANPLEVGVTALTLEEAYFLGCIPFYRFEQAGIPVLYYNGYTYRSVPGRHPWALKHNSQFWPTWVLTQDQNPICLYRSCYSGPLKCGTWALPGSGCLPGTLRYMYMTLCTMVI